MKRNLDICRHILLYLEQQHFGANFIEVHLDGVDIETVSYHLMLMKQANLVEALDISKSNENFDWRAKYITWKGHEFLEAARNEQQWCSARSLLQEEGGCEIFEVLQRVLVEGMSQRVLKRMQDAKYIKKGL